MAAIDSLSLAYQTQCLGDDQDADPLMGPFKKSLPAAYGESSRAEARLFVLATIDPLEKAAAVERARQTPGSPAAVQLNNLAGAIASARAGADALLSPADVPILQTGSWKWDAGAHKFGAASISVEPLVREACTPITAAACKPAYETGAFILRVARLVERSLTFYGSPLLAAAVANATMRDTQWTAYFDGTLAQYPWELGLNSVLFTRSAVKTAGFVWPPSHAWVVVHPTVGLEYVKSAPKGSRMEPTVLLEAVGYNRWWWNADNAPAHALGASFVLAFSDRPETDSLGYGVLVRYAHRYSVAVTRRSGMTGIVVSSEVGQWITGASKKARDAMRLAGR